MKWYLAVLRNYAGFTGRAHREEYWMFFLFNLLFNSLVMTLDHFLGTSYKFPSGYEGFYYSFGLLQIAYGLLILLPNLAVNVRRLHDVGKSGWMILLAFLPVVGWIWLFVLLVTDSQPGDNQYGPNPKAA